MLIVNVTQTKVVLALSPEEFSELIEQSRVGQLRARRSVLAESKPVPLASVLPRVSP